MNCNNCNSNNTYVKSYEHVYNIKGKTIKFKADRRFCKDCNSLIYDDKLDNEASVIAINKYNELYGITKEEIINLRKKFNLSQELFAKVIGCAKKTLISYEKGKSIPNDSYLIIIKSLIKNPNTILTILDANKEQFTDKELDRINSKLPNNIKQLKFNSDFIPSEYNGYSKISKEKIYNIILYLSDNLINKTKLLKEMFYIDFTYYKNYGKSITGLEYIKLTYGPVPDEFEFILTDCLNNNIIDYELEYKDDYECHYISSKKEFNKDLFNKEELDILKNIKTKFKNYSVKEIVEYSHKEDAFNKTDYKQNISYDYAFDLK